MKTHRAALAVLLSLSSWGGVGCSLDQAKAGESCRRSTECEPGLGCVRNRCSRDLGPIADESTVPDLRGDAGAGDAAPGITGASPAGSSAGTGAADGG